MISVIFWDKRNATSQDSLSLSVDVSSCIQLVAVSEHKFMQNGQNDQQNER